MTKTSLPVPNSILKEFNRIFRMAQKDFQFASIWEHRQTRNVLIAGFSTLGEVINNLEYTINASLSDLQYSVSRGFDSSIHEQRQTQKQIDEYGEVIENYLSKKR